MYVALYSALVSFSELNNGFLLTVSPEEVGSEELRAALKDRFDRMCRGILQQIQRNLDQRQLGLKQNIFQFDGAKKSKKSEILQKIMLKWNALELSVEPSDFVSDCVDSQSCRAMKRIRFVMDLFDRYFLRKFIAKPDDANAVEDVDYMGILMDGLYHDGIALLDDFQHIREHTLVINDMIKCHHSDGDGKCIGGMMRKYRESESRDDNDDESDDSANAFKQYVAGLELRQRHLLDTSTKIHSYLCHEAHEEKCNETVGVAAQIKAKPIGRDVDELKSKFVNEMSGEEISEKLETNRMDDLSHALWENGLSVDQCCQLMNMLYSQGYDSDAIAADFLDLDGDDPFNLYPQSNLFPMLNGNKFLAKITKKHVGAKQNDDDPLPPFTFGMQTLRHWKHWDDEPGYVGSPNYNSLKEECLQNKIYPMPMKQFLRMVFDAVAFSRSGKGRRQSANSLWGDNQVFEVFRGSPLSVSHIFVVLMYCNDTKLQYNYKKFGCRERYKGQTLEELKKWNREIAHWHRLLFEAVKFFGQLVSPTDVFYTGLNIRLCFHTFSPKFHSPFSTTVSIEVAERFCGSDGVILMLKPTTSSLECYLDVEWLSDFDHEKERLFATAFMGSLMIANIQYFDSGKWWKSGKYMTAFELFSALFSGHFFFSSFGASKKKTRKARKVLLKLIVLHKVKNGFQLSESDAGVLDFEVPLYMQQLLYSLIDGFRQRKDPMFVIRSEFALLDEPLKRELIWFSKKSSSSADTLRLSPLVRTFCGLDQIVVMEEYVWIIDQDNLKKLKREQHDDGIDAIHSELYYFDLHEAGKVSIKMQFDGGVGSDDERTVIGFEIINTPVPVDGRWSAVCNEAEWKWNEVCFYNKNNGEWQNRVAFKDSITRTTEKLTIRLALHLSPSKGKKVLSRC